jgi:hypothetical protein
MQPNLLTLTAISGVAEGTTIFLPRFKLHGDEIQLGFKMSRTQFPIRLCYAMTIHKSQGQTIKHVGIDGRDEIFTHGQLYVAMSRVTTIGELRVLLPSITAPVRNVVYAPALLQNGPAPVEHNGGPDEDELEQLDLMMDVDLPQQPQEFEDLNDINFDELDDLVELAELQHAVNNEHIAMDGPDQDEMDALDGI